jgi:hypothetical protein
MLELSLPMSLARRDCTSEYATARVELCVVILTFAAAVVDQVYIRTMLHCAVLTRSGLPGTRFNRRYRSESWLAEA